MENTPTGSFNKPSTYVAAREVPNHLSCPDCWKRPQRHVDEVSHLREEKMIENRLTEKKS